MGNFCGKCGARLDQSTGQCPNCDKPIAPPVENHKQPKGKGKKEPTKQSTKKGRKPLLILLCVLGSLFVLFGTLFALSYFDVISIPLIDSLFETSQESTTSQASSQVASGGNTATSSTTVSTGPYSVVPPNADEYYQNNATVLSTTPANTSTQVQTEAEVIAFLTQRGFTVTSVTTTYNMNGEYMEDKEINSSSSEKHPIYSMKYQTATGDYWMISVINGTILANPVTYNLQSTRQAPLVVSEKNSVVSYDGTSNKFYETIPKNTEQIVKRVTEINAALLETLTIGVLNQ